MTLLKREFKEKDVERMRNLVRGKYGDKNDTFVGYEKHQKTYEEGDVWTEHDQTWTIKNGIRQNITILDEAKKQIHCPLFCPSCNKLMKQKSDKTFYLQYNRCTNCQIDFETDLKKKGLWNEFEKEIINQDIDQLTKDFEVWFEDMITNQDTNSFITEVGDIEAWDGTVTDKLMENKKSAIAYLQSLKK
jgi:Pyruvate/2-oxoacid:ferredoxin oxidoreductase delta subunit